MRTARAGSPPRTSQSRSSTRSSTHAIRTAGSPWVTDCPRHPYPAALDDVLRAYRALLAQGLPADRIVLVGHSAGATLALSALQRLRDSGDPMPVCAVALCPITDFTLSGTSLTTNAETDIVGVAELHHGSTYVGAPNHRPLSPVCPDIRPRPAP
ncbi:alpha/beta hydrolase [Streptomyces sp. NPDC059398]|uniref:alpha/beta hydrolase n=1 Tax=Streptomyces sp. NPDC059398 TaxID=3346820 RepID=UPI0036BDF979